jgi:hypothetical protein
MSYNYDIDNKDFSIHINKRNMMDTKIWSRWKGLAETVLTIPKFKRVWKKTKDVHATEFKDFIDSLYNIP